MFNSGIWRLFLAFTATISSVNALVDPTEIYNGGLSSGTTDVLLRIATGGAGQSGLVKGRPVFYHVPCAWAKISC
jgi:hypothetical protein